MLSKLGTKLVEIILSTIVSFLWECIMSYVDRKKIEDKVEEINDMENRDEASRAANDLMHS